jgi:hypothetical protein
MTSERQIAANRRNASLSTGPRTAAGKAVVAQNALRHGMLAKQIIVPGESETDLVDFGKRMHARLAPMDELEMLLVDRIISSAWRLRRTLRAEADLMASEPDVAAAFRGYTGKHLERVSRYETTLERGLYRALQELQRLQAEREGREGGIADSATGAE